MKTFRYRFRKTIFYMETSLLNENCLRERRPTRKSYPSAAAYADEVRQWMVSAHCWMICHQMASSHSYASFLAQLSPPQSLPSNSPPQQATASVPQRLIQQHTIPPFARRIVAEGIDFIFAFAVKLFIVYFLVEINVIDLDKYDRLLSEEADLQALINVTQDLFPIEILGKIMISIVEALCISYGWASMPAGSTPGKAVMGIQVVTCYEITPIPGTDYVRVVRDLNVPFKNSLLRSLFKNMVINLLFPISTAAYAFNYNRAVYDLAAKTIVVYM
ncbi:hypothetical protein AB6A40_005523 [Gnathostoma spinigerum]|uniref:RDD domain-containing protein n=1 Tax=Gnathostoma spinigerum TaxID=75299 RepID=A0ABD6ENB4_9BILA